MEVKVVGISRMAEILDYLEDYHVNGSNLKDVPFSRKDTRKVVEYYMRASDCIALIGEYDGEVKGVLLGGLEPFFFNSKKCYATDMLFVSNGAGLGLLRKFKEWAFSRGADRIMMGVSSGDSRAGDFLELFGFEPTGGMYVLCKESG